MSRHESEPIEVETESYHDAVKVRLDGWGVEVYKGWQDVDYGELVEALNPGYNWFHGRGGDYQGDWICIGYKYGRAPRQWVMVSGSFGSCSGCDWIQSIADNDGLEKLIKHCKKLEPIGTNVNEVATYLAKEAINGWGYKQQAIRDVGEKIAAAGTFHGEPNEFPVEKMMDEIREAGE